MSACLVITEIGTSLQTKVHVNKDSFHFFNRLSRRYDTFTKQIVIAIILVSAVSHYVQTDGRNVTNNHLELVWFMLKARFVILCDPVTKALVSIANICDTRRQSYQLYQYAKKKKIVFV